MRRFKFERRRDALDALLPWLVERVVDLPLDGIVPVPRHPARIRARRDDPAWLLARRLGLATGVRVLDGALERARPCRAQTGLDPAERARNVRGSFRARSAALAGRSVLLLDDVVTTGATLREAAAVLRAHSGARRVLTGALAATPAPAL